VCFTGWQASATRALQRLNGIPELQGQLAASAAGDVLLVSAPSSLLNTRAVSGSIPGCTDQLVAAAAALEGEVTAACAMPVAAGSSTAAGAGGGSSGGAAASGGQELLAAWRLAEAVATSSSRRTRELAVCELELLLAEDAPTVCRWCNDEGTGVVARSHGGHSRLSAWLDCDMRWLVV